MPMPNPALLYLVILPLTVALGTVLLREAGRRTYVAVAVATSLALCIMFVGVNLADGKTLRQSLEPMTVIMALPVVGAFIAGAWSRHAKHPWLAFLVVPVAFWVVLYALLATAL